MERFGHFDIAQGPDAQPVELLRSPEEFVCLAFDTRIKRLVEFHVVKSADGLSAAERRSIFERARLAAGVGTASFARVLECGADGDLVYFCTGLNDGELLDAYIARRGPLSMPIALSLLMRLLDDVLLLREIPRLLSGLQLEDILVTVQEETFLQLRGLDLGLSSPEAQECTEEQTARRLVHEICLAAFLMLNGRPYAGDDCDRLKVLTALPSGMRTLLRASLADGPEAPSSLERLRDQMRDAVTAQTRDLQGRNSRRHLVATDSLLPQSSLREVLLHDLRMEQLIKGRLVAANPEAQQRYPFTFQGADARTGAPLNVHLLPPRRIVSNEHYDPVPLQMWRCDAEKHPNILRSLGAWESPDLTFLTEEHSPGVPLSRLMAERLFLNPTEVSLVLRQVKAGLDQAQECGVERLDIHPCNIFLKLGSALPAREMEKLLQKRLDVWPKFTVMLRPHMTMRSLYEPLLVDDEEAPDEDRSFDAQDFINRSYVVLAGYLLSGERQVSGRQRLPDSLPEELVAFVTDSTAQSRHAGQAPLPGHFLLEFERRTFGPELPSHGNGLKLPERGSVPRAEVAVEAMESAGSVSDFDEDLPEEPVVESSLEAEDDPPSTIAESSPAFAARAGGKERSKWMLVAAVLLVLAVIAYAVLFLGKDSGRRVESPPPRPNPAPQSVPEVTRAQPPAEPPKKPSQEPSITEEVRRALVPSSREKEELRKLQQGPSSSNCVVPPTAQAALRFIQRPPAVGLGNVGPSLSCHPLDQNHLMRRGDSINDGQTPAVSQFGR